MSKIKVEIINKEEVTKLFKNWGEFSCTCYNTPKKFATKVGKSCFNDKHYSGSRTEYIKFDISGVSRACVDQLVRSEQGVVKNVMSGRYVDFSQFDYYTPSIIDTDDVLSKLYHEAMEKAQTAYGALVIKLGHMGITGEKAFEVARGVAPMNHCTAVTIGFTVEALINFMHKRLCVCSQQEISALARAMKKAVIEVLPEIESKLVPACEALLYCPESEKRTCGRYPREEEIRDLVETYRNVQKSLSKKERK